MSNEERTKKSMDFVKERYGNLEERTDHDRIFECYLYEISMNLATIADCLESLRDGCNRKIRTDKYGNALL